MKNFRLFGLFEMVKKDCKFLQSQDPDTVDEIREGFQLVGKGKPQIGEPEFSALYGSHVTLFF